MPTIVDSALLMFMKKFSQFKNGHYFRDDVVTQISCMSCDWPLFSQQYVDPIMFSRPNSSCLISKKWHIQVKEVNSDNFNRVIIFDRAC